MNANDCIFQSSVGKGDVIPITHFEEAKCLRKHFLIATKDAITRRHNASSSKRKRKKNENGTHAKKT